MHDPAFHLTLLGSCGLQTREGEVVDIPQGKPLALLAYVALAPEPPTRDELAQLLWPDATRKRARGSLRQALWKLRTVLGEDAFTSDDPVALRDDLIRVDVHLLRSHLREGRLLQAVELWQGSFVEDLDLRGVPEWERWVDGIRGELERRLGSALADRGNRERELQPGESAIPWLEHAVQIQPHRLEHHLDLAEAHLESRAFDDASRALSVARKRFEDPAALEDIASVEERILQLRRGVPAALPDSGSNLRLQFTGRTREFAALVRRWHLAREGESSVGLILGEAGIGKTRLAEEVALLARSEGARVVQVKAEDSERPIEWALLGELVRNLLPLSGAAGISSGSQDVLRSLLPSLPPGAGGVSSQEDSIPPGLPRTRPSAALTDALQDLLAAVSEDAPLLVIVDDLQWADGESRSVLARAATRLDDVPILVLITSRTGGPDVSPRIGKTLNLLARAQSSLHLELSALTEDETRSLITRTLNAPSRRETERVVERVIRASRGNPLFVLELMNVLRDQGILSEGPDGRWTLIPEQVPETLPLPASLRELINQQLDQLSQSGSLVAAHLARARHPVSPRVIAARTGMSQSALTDGVSELIQRRIVHWGPGEKLAFAHDELRAAVSRRFQLHVGLTTGGGAHWSLFRSAVVATLLLLIVGAGVYASRGDPAPNLPALGGGPLLLTMAGDSTVEARASAMNPTGSWQIQALSSDSFPPAGEESELKSSLRQEGKKVRIPSMDESRILEIHWAADGVDSAHVAPPGRSEPAKVQGWEKIHGASWCGGTPASLILSVEEGDGAQVVVWHPEEDMVQSIDLAGIPGSLLACSPDGRYAAVATARDGDLELVLLDLAAGNRHRVPLEDLYGLRQLQWASDRPIPTPTAVHVEGEGEMELDWGDRGVVRARIHRDDGSISSDGIQWTSRDPSIVSVTPRGRLSANRPGRAVLVASFADWLTDSLTVNVRGGEHTPQVLFWDAAPPQQSSGWLPLPASPVPFPSRARAALEDPVGIQAESQRLAPPGWRSARGFDLPGGGTLEADLHLTPHAVPLQTCLTHVARKTAPPEGAETLDPPADSLASAESSASPHRFCVSIWHDGGSRLMGEVHYHPAFPPLALDASEPGLNNAREPRHLALAILADGTGAVLLDQEEVMRTPLRVQPERAGRWHVEIGGTVVAPGDGLQDPGFGSLLLWPEVRF